MKVSVVGSGAWGTALAIRLLKNGHDVTVWTFEKDLIPEMEATRRNPRLPGAVLPEGLKISGDYACVAGSKLVVIASPSFPMRSVCRGVAPHLDADAVVVSVTKGIEDGTCKRMSQIVAEETTETQYIPQEDSIFRPSGKYLPSESYFSRCRPIWYLSPWKKNSNKDQIQTQVHLRPDCHDIEL